MASKSKKEIDFGKTQSVIVDYIDFRRNMEWLAPAMIIIGLFLAFLISSLVTSYVPSLDDETLVLEVGLILALLVGIDVWLIIVGGRLSFKLVYKRSETLRRMHSVHNNLIRKSYFINFELVRTTGSTRLEKLINHLALVFPEIKKNFKKFEGQKIPNSVLQKRQNFRKKVNFLNSYDLVLKTTMGLFVIKILNKTVTFEDVENIAKQLRRHHISTKFLGGPEIERVVIMSNSYNNLFDTPDLSKKMSGIPRSFHIDLILEENEYGYATVWID